MTRWPLAFIGAAALAFGASAAASSPRALEWKRAAPLPVPRSEVAAATVGRELVVIGGFLANGNSSKRVDAYSPAKNRWRMMSC